MSVAGPGRFARLVPYTDPDRGLPQSLEVVDVIRRRTWSLPIPPEGGRWRRFQEAAVRDTVAVFFNAFDGTVRWATLRGGRVTKGQGRREP